ncbi:hypothetical protein BKA69DRAFT_1081365, partial [Paraphysoderma sedebokerense]
SGVNNKDQDADNPLTSISGDVKKYENDKIRDDDRKSEKSEGEVSDRRRSYSDLRDFRDSGRSSRGSDRDYRDLDRDRERDYRNVDRDRNRDYYDRDRDRDYRSFDSGYRDRRDGHYGSYDDYGRSSIRDRSYDRTRSRSRERRRSPSYDRGRNRSRERGRSRYDEYDRDCYRRRSRSRSYERERDRRREWSPRDSRSPYQPPSRDRDRRRDDYQRSRSRSRDRRRSPYRRNSRDRSRSDERRPDNYRQDYRSRSRTRSRSRDRPKSPYERDSRIRRRDEYERSRSRSPYRSSARDDYDRSHYGREEPKERAFRGDDDLKPASHTAEGHVRSDHKIISPKHDYNTKAEDRLRNQMDVDQKPHPSIEYNQNRIHPSPASPSFGNESSKPYEPQPRPPSFRPSYRPQTSAYRPPAPSYRYRPSSYTQGRSVGGPFRPLESRPPHPHSEVDRRISGSPELTQYPAVSRSSQSPPIPPYSNSDLSADLKSPLISPGRQRPRDSFAEGTNSGPLSSAAPTSHQRQSFQSHQTHTSHLSHPSQPSASQQSINSSSSASSSMSQRPVPPHHHTHSHGHSRPSSFSQYQSRPRPQFNHGYYSQFRPPSSETSGTPGYGTQSSTYRPRPPYYQNQFQPPPANLPPRCPWAAELEKESAQLASESQRLKLLELEQIRDLKKIQFEVNSVTLEVEKLDMIVAFYDRLSGSAPGSNVGGNVIGSRGSGSGGESIKNFEAMQV